MWFKIYFNQLPGNLFCGDPLASSSGITENLPRCKNGDDVCGIKRNLPIFSVVEPEEVAAGAAETINRPRDDSPWSSSFDATSV